MRSPQAFQQFQNLQKSQNNPQEFLNTIVSKYTPEQLNQFRQYANSFGFSNEQLDKYGINSKKSWYKKKERRRKNE